ncbi:PLP-dependent aminotransferase family protein [Nitrincola tibetensis]|uniref:PLP-dependent aminotransferase family protein n=1 Tax=Nitrincola tibetensis TaxID=2219697 RepID=A0A364NKB4_9GAMM|nr:PLP-dependent aminotransferase family protein [Nitrincola tibetensis]RAU17474.1 PLP-dependent aminotransferase family protein [Nitrincola tibetensis]
MDTSLSSLTLSINPDEGKLYLQLIHQIKSAVQSQRLTTGSRLPSSRALASALGISRSTVSQAYDQLLAEGILVSEPKKGVFIAQTANSQLHSPERPCPTPSPALKTKRFDSGIDIEVFPVKEWAKSMRRSWLTPDPSVLKGEYWQGLPRLKHAIADYLYQLRGLTICADQVFLTAGSRDSLHLLQQTLRYLAPKATFWLENPTYPPLINAFQGLKAPVRFLSIDADGTRPPPRSEQTSVCVLTPNRQYPLGTSMSSQRRDEWFKQMDQNPLWIIEDDYDNEFVYQGHSGVPLIQMDRMNRIFFMGSFSKVLFRGLRLSFVIAPLPHCRVISQVQTSIAGTVSLSTQPALEDFMLSGAFGRHLNRMRRHYRHKRDLLVTLVEKHLSDWFEWTNPLGGMHLTLHFKTCWLEKNSPKFWDQHIADELLKQQIMLSSLSSHYAPNAQCIPSKVLQGFVLGFTGTSFEDMALMIKHLKQCLLNIDEQH